MGQRVSQTDWTEQDKFYDECCRRSSMSVAGNKCFVSSVCLAVLATAVYLPCACLPSRGCRLRDAGGVEGSRVNTMWCVCMRVADPKYALGHRLRVWPILFTGSAGILADDYIMSQYCSRFARHQVQQGHTVTQFYSPIASDKPERTVVQLGPFRVTTREGTPTCVRVCVRACM